MTVYSVIMFVTALLLGVFAVAIHNGNTNLIHSYHQTKVKDKQAYGKAFGRAFFVTAAAPLASGAIALFGETAAMTAVIVLVSGLVIGIALICIVQMKYNKGIF